MGITGSITWPGVNYPQHLVATRTNGARPDVALLFALPQNSTPSITGTLSFGFDSTTLTWTDALLDRFSMTASTASGFRQIFAIKDRRWRWEKHYITGAYNVRLPDGTIDSATEKTLAELATLLFTAAGESANVAAITSTEKPMVVWDQSNVADELEALLEQRGYVISLQTDNTAKVYAGGTGAVLPANGDVVSVAVSVDPPELPENLYAALQKTVVQSKLLMEPYGLDTDGRIRRTADLSYSPGSGTSGFDGMDLESFDYLTDPVAQEYARLSIGKWYGVKAQADGTQNITDGSTNYVPGEISVTDVRQLLPLSDELVQAAENVFGVAQKQPAFVEGTFEDTTTTNSGAAAANPPAKGSDRNTPEFTKVSRRDWELDGKSGVVKFFAPAFKWDSGTSKRTFADVYLTCSYSISHPTQWVKDRELRAKNLGGYGDEVIELTELQRTMYCTYTSNTTISAITDTLSTVESDADLYLNAAANKYATSVGNILLYRGIYNFNTDGVASQIVWQCAAPGSAVPFSTHVSQNAEVHPLLPTKKQRGLAREARRVRNTDTTRQYEYIRSQRTTDPQ